MKYQIQNNNEPFNYTVKIPKDDVFLNKMMKYLETIQTSTIQKDIEKAEKEYEKVRECLVRKIMKQLYEEVEKDIK